MAEHIMGLQEKYFLFMKYGTKRIELRLNDEKRRGIKIGDIIHFNCQGNDSDETTIKTKVIGRLDCRDFAELFAHFQNDMTLFADRKVFYKDMLKTMERFYPLEKQHTNGVVGLFVELL